MSGTLSTRWFWSDWMSDPGLRACGYAARGLWKDLLCIAGSNKAEYGYVSLNGNKLDAAAIARMTNGTVDEVDKLLAELGRNGVYSKDRRGVIYCRRMVRAEKSRSNGRLGGNPNSQIRSGTVPKESRIKRKSFSFATRQRLFHQDGGKCRWCQCDLILRWEGKGDVPLNYMHIDHIVAICDGGTDIWENLAASCRSCNGERSLVSSHRTNKGNMELGTARAPPPIPVVPEPGPVEEPAGAGLFTDAVATSDWPKDYRERFWSLYPRRTEKKAALAKLDAIRKSGKVRWTVLIEGVARYARHMAGTEDRFIKHPTTWLNRGCWDDEFAPGEPGRSQGSETRSGAASLLVRMYEQGGGHDDSVVENRPALPAR